MSSPTLGNVLVVDDEVQLMNALVEALGSQGYQVTGLATGEAALEAMQRQEFDLLLTDLMMPGMNGISLLKAALALDKNLVGIIMTGQGTVPTAVEAMKTGAFDYILKPFRLEAMLPVLARAREVRRLRMENIQLRETVAIYNLSQTIAFSLDSQLVLENTADAALQQTDADEVSIMLFTPDRQELFVAAVRGKDREHLLGQRVSMQEGIAGWVARQSEPLILNGEVSDPRFTPVRPRAEIHSAISMPMLAAGKMVGVLNVNTLRARHSFTPGQIKALSILTSTASAALENEGLYRALAKREEHFRALIENSTDAVTLLNSEGRFLYTSASVQRVLGYAPTELLEQSAFELIHPDDQGMMLAGFMEALQEPGEAGTTELRVRHKDGSWRWIEGTAQNMLDKPAVQAIVVNFSDISERKQAESQIKYHARLLRHINDAVIATDDQFRITAWNRAAEKMYGWSDEEVMRRDVNEILGSELTQEQRAEAAQLLRESHISRGERIYDRKDGQTIYVEENAIVLTDEAGKMTGYVSVHRDITERKQAEEALRNSQMQLSGIFNSAMDAIISTDADEHILIFNPAAETMFHCRQTEAIGQPLERFIPERFRVSHQEHLQNFARSGVSNRSMGHLGQIYGLRSDGKEFPIEASISKINVSGQAIFTVILRDITERKQAEEQLRLSEERFKAEYKNIPLPTYTWQKQGEDFHLIDYNLAAESLGTQAVLEQMLGIPASRFLAPIPELLAVMSDCFEEKSARRWESRYQLQTTGAAIDAVFHVAFVPPDLVMIHVEDVTERKQAEEALQKAHARAESILASVADSHILIDHEWRFLYINDAAVRAMRRPREEILGRTVWETYPDIIGTELDRQFHRTMDERIPVAFEFHYETRDTWWENHFYPVAEGLAIFATDITERKRAEDALRESEKRYRNLFERITHGFALHEIIGDENGRPVDYRFLEINPAFEALTGLRASEAIGRTVLEVLPGTESSWIETYGRVALTGESIQFHHYAQELGKHYEVTAYCPKPGQFAVLFSDVTERKRTEDKLREAEAKFRTLVEQVPAITYVSSPGQNVLLYISPQVEALGYSQAEWLASPPLWPKLVHPDDHERVLAEFRQSMALGKPAQSEYRLITRDGHPRWFRDQAQMVRDEQGNALYLQGIMLDITERKQAEEQIQRQLRHLNALHMIDLAISSSFDLNVVLDIVLQQVILQLEVDACAVLLFNPQLQTIEYAASRGFRSEALKYTQLRMGEGYASQAVLKRKTVHISELMETGGKLANALQAAGEEFADYYGTPLIVKGEVKGVLEIYHRSRLRADPEWLEFLETLTGQAAIAVDNAELFTGLQLLNARLEQRVVERTAELHHLNLELQQANRAKNEFLANMSHELRTPLNSVLGMSESLLEQRRGPLNEHQQQFLQVIHSSGQHLLELINDVLDLSKIEAGRFDYYPQLVEVDALCRSSLAFVKEQANRKAIDLTYEDDQTVSKIQADPRRLKQALINLLTNAVKFTPEGGQVALQVHAHAEQDLLQLAVIDNGIGISAEDMQKLFQPFVQVDSSLTRQFEGTGLGLALVQKLIDLHGGSVSVESEVGKGSRFTINLLWQSERVAQQEAIEARGELSTGEAVEESKPSAEETPARGVILLAEDNMANTITIGEYLESHSYTVVYAYNGLEALEKADEAEPDLILMDIQMPAMDGLEAMRRLRANPRFASTPVIALTALAMPGDRERCLEAGATEYMSKPVSLRILLSTIGKLLGHTG